MALVGEDKFTVTLPEPDASTDDIEAFMNTLTLNTDVHGTKTLHTRLSKYLVHRRLTDSFWAGVRKAADVVNGHRTPSQKKADTLRSKTMTTTRFYESLSTPALRRHAAMYGVDYDSYEDQNDIIAVVVEKHIATEMGE